MVAKAGFGRLRRVVIEPLGVVRRTGGARRRLWWRLLPPVAGIALLYPLLNSVSKKGPQFNQNQVVAGIVLLLLGVTAILPWLVEAVVRRISGGPVPWQLAVRRLQLSSGSSARVVNGVAVAVAGAIALHMLFVGVERSYTRMDQEYQIPGSDPNRVQVQGRFALHDKVAAIGAAETRLRETPGVYTATAFTQQSIVTERGGYQVLSVATCASLRDLLEMDTCADGDTFIVSAVSEPDPGPSPGDRIRLGDDAADHQIPQWRVPANARLVKARDSQVQWIGYARAGVYATPAAAATIPPRDTWATLYSEVNPRDRNVYENLRNVAASVNPLMTMEAMSFGGSAGDYQFNDIRRGVILGSMAVLLVIGASLLVTTLEQLRQRKRLLAMLVAVGVRRSTLSASVLWQTAIPVLLGLVLAVAVGTGLGVLLLGLASLPQSFDWVSVAKLSGVAAAVVLLVTALSLPALWRLTRPDGLRTE